MRNSQAIDDTCTHDCHSAPGGDGVVAALSLALLLSTERAIEIDGRADERPVR
jgi:hypothetical protein